VASAFCRSTGFSPRRGFRNRAYKRRRSASDDRLLIFVCENELSYPRLGLSVGKKWARGAPQSLEAAAARSFSLERERLPAGVEPGGDPAPQIEPSWRPERIAAAAVEAGCSKLTRP